MKSTIVKWYSKWRKCKIWPRFNK